MPAGGVIAHLTVKCGGNIHDKGAVEVTASSVAERGENWRAFRNAADLGTDSCFWSNDRPGQWICWDFKALRIEPTRYTILTFNRGLNCPHLKNWMLEGSDDEGSWTEIDQRENNRHLNDDSAVKTFAVARSGSFHRIRLRQTGPNHMGCNRLGLMAFEIFDAVAGLQ
jgi:hypothetical protein